MKHFTLHIENRPSSFIAAIQEDGNGIGSIFLAYDDQDLVPYINAMINGFNQKYTEEAPQNTTGGDGKPRGGVGRPASER